MNGRPVAAAPRGGSSAYSSRIRLLIKHGCADCYLEAGMLREGSQASKGRAGGVVKSSDERIPHAGWIHERRLKARYLTCSQRADAPCGVAAKASRAAVLPKMIDDFAARAGKTA